MDVLRRGGFLKNIRALFPEVDFQDKTSAGLFDCIIYFSIVAEFDIRFSGP